MTKNEIIKEIQARIKYKKTDKIALAAAGRYCGAFKLQSQAEELTHLLSVIIDGD